MLRECFNNVLLCARRKQDGRKIDIEKINLFNSSLFLLFKERNEWENAPFNDSCEYKMANIIY